MNCEFCGNEIDGKYGSGRFCNRACACAFSTRNKRQQINASVSVKLKGRRVHDGGFKKGYDPNRRQFDAQDRLKSVQVSRKKREDLYRTLTWDNLPMSEKRRRVLKDQRGVCLGCGLKRWRGKPLKLGLHHVTGDRKDNRRENLQMLCPNCHSQTPTWKNNRRSGRRMA